MSFSGMDLEAVLKHARTLEVDAAHALFEVITRMQGLIPDLLDAWHGPDAERFARQWEIHQQTLTNLHRTLTEVASSVGSAAAAQAKTSGH